MYKRSRYLDERRIVHEKGGGVEEGISKEVVVEVYSTNSLGTGSQVQRNQ
jgi:hypothetical protein